jgi:HAD superfamily hydrolase (TIGR01456 family)
MMNADNSVSPLQVETSAVLARDPRTVAFAFDVDGVLLRSKQPLPGAAETIATLQRRGIPFIFLTNGGGLTEADHAARLGSRLSLEIDEAQFVQSHSPFRDLVPLYHDKLVVALGGHGQQIRQLAHAYGFRHVLTSADIAACEADMHPFPEMTEAHHSEHGRPGAVRLAKKETDGRVKAILVFSSPRDWCLDL